VAHKAGRGSRIARASRGGEDETYKAGDRVQAVCADDEEWYPATVEKANADGTFSVKWDDPDGGPELSDVKTDVMKMIIIYKDYKVDEEVEAVFPDDGNMYPGKVTKINADGTFEVKWEDPDGGPETSSVTPEDMKYPPIPLDKLEVGQKYAGTIVNTAPFGAFVDFGAERQGLVHISCLTDGFVDNVDDVVQAGQEVEVWVKQVSEDGKIGLTMVESKLGGGGGGGRAPRAPVDLSGFVDSVWGDRITGKVVSITNFGCFVQLEAPTGDAGPQQGLVHISEMSDGFVEDPWSITEVGAEVSVVVKDVDADSGRLSLTMKSTD
jgi:predicted RNA-binding protein with RPS1 domain